MNDNIAILLEQSKDFFTLSQDNIYNSFYKTGNDNLDEYLEGGLPLGKLIHIYGPSGVGKSQFCMQLAANMWKQEKIRRCYFFCCNKVSFIPSRYLQICSELGIEKSENELLSNVFIAELSSVEDVVDMLNELTASEDEVCVFDFSEHDDVGEQFAFTEGLAQALLSLSEWKKCLTIFVNQVRAAFDMNQSSDVIPALGQNFYLHALLRIFMDFQSEERSVKKIELTRWTIPYKDPFLFILTKRGIEALP
uniref:DNA recombination and repair protein Rad51-like C-terminal domain-containing protein n=1 Tax=Panagrolaimus davidi TaxID=227884 RepID=A0A914Q3R6_9BILA